jgi:hypothetical protein
MCCNEGHGHHHGRHHGGGCEGGGCSCGCGDGSQCECGKGGFERQFQTKAEQIAELEEYLGELKAEVQAVEERLTDLRK